MLQTGFRPSCMNRAWVFEWHKRFKEGRESVRDDSFGRHKEVRTPAVSGQIKNFIDKDRHVSIETISAQFDVSVGNVHTIIRELLKMQKISAKFVPRMHKEDQKERRCHDSREMVELVNSDPAVLDAVVNLQWKLDLLLWPRDQDFPVEVCWLSQTQEGQTEKIQQGTFDDPLFLTALALSTCTGQSTMNTILRFQGSSGRDSVGKGQHSSNRVSGFSTRTMHQFTTPSLSLTIWPRWASRPCSLWLLVIP